MLHDQGLTPASTAKQVPVNRAEYEKFCYLIKVMDAVDRAHYIAKEHAKELRMSDGVSALMDFDWRNTVQFVAPQLQVVFLRDKHNNPAEQAFMRYPFAVIVARNAQVVELDDVFELSLEEFDVSANVTKVDEAFRTLESTAQSLGGKRMQDATRVIQTLRRVLKTE